VVHFGGSNCASPAVAHAVAAVERN
jgi:hypothetical protein